ncbi:Ppx/GppA phosphatase family protein [Nocardioides limicola]|uniref:Ppx/GppA phosphatase family protein n=1 Tax=Nocardioides limicola TaxID=2803368 RepID=UPI0027DD59EB|nr:exopolyphosphatase [Nocardioides sp. DJM-14]
MATNDLTIAAIDCGTNTIKLLIGALPDVAVRESRMVRLGQGLDEHGEISAEALERAFAAIDEYAELIAEHGADRISFCATSATRDAKNARVFTEGVRERLGADPVVLSGTEEAALSFDGAVRHLRVPAPEPVLVVDVGGGSTELILGTAADGPQQSQSIDIGSVRLHERHLHSDPPQDEEIAACLADIDAHLDRCRVELATASSVVLVAGTALTLSAGVLHLPRYDREAIDQSVLKVDAVHAMAEELVHMPLGARLRLGWMEHGRADVIGAGGLIVSRVLRRTRVREVIASEADILDGIAWALHDALVDQ